VGVRHVIHPGAIYTLLHSPTGGVARDMLRRGIRVQSQARRNLAGGGGKPRRIDTGLLRASVYARPVRISGKPGARVGSDVRYARLVHDGTGIYGPRHARITPKRGRYLVFTPKGAQRRVFARSVAGMRPNAFLKDALSAAKG
jgi:hypothetical protein